MIRNIEDKTIWKENSHEEAGNDSAEIYMQIIFFIMQIASIYPVKWIMKAEAWLIRLINKLFTAFSTYQAFLLSYHVFQVLFLRYTFVIDLLWEGREKDFELQTHLWKNSSILLRNLIH